MQIAVPYIPRVYIIPVSKVDLMLKLHPSPVRYKIKSEIPIQNPNKLSKIKHMKSCFTPVF